MATKKAKKPEPVLVDGRPPPPLPPPEGPLSDLIELLHATEKSFVGNQNAPPTLKKLEGELAELREGKRGWKPAEVSAFALSLGLDLGQFPDSLDRTRLTTRAQWKQQDAQFDALTGAAFVRTQTWSVIVTVISLEPALQLEWLERLEHLKPWSRDWLQRVLLAAPVLSAQVIERLREWLRGGGIRSAIAAESFFKQSPHVAFEELSPLIDQFGLDEQASLEQLHQWLSEVNWKETDFRWGPVLSRFVPLAAVPYNFAQANLIRRQNSVGQLATKALEALSK